MPKKKADDSSEKSRSSSIISRKAASVAKAVKKGAKAASRPFKKVKRAISTLSISTHSARSCSPTPTESDDGEPINIDNPASEALDERDNGDTNVSGEIDPKKELGK